MAVPPAPDPGLTTDPSHPAHAPSGRLRLVLLAVLVVVLLIGGALSAWLLADRPGALPGRDSAADTVQHERERVMAQARQFMLRGQTYGPDALDDDGKLGEYRGLVEEVVTPKFMTEFDQTVTVAEQLVSQQGVSRSAEVLGVGVETIDDDSAVALVTGQITSTLRNAKGKEVPARSDLFRVVVDLVEVDGDWLVDGFEQASEAAQ
ncbi:hypothetical protein GHK92_01600 [Nocardioides sp. dk4132]|uniref:hypothetical protein n=1 Tax=unclassified Nocardioides TaxID=2615069 RepID=UPI001294BB97|nr:MULTISPECIES: hypothetical protein [unclassified Nocardioides]MQW74558.1 hypothetical protein [Nocardioides sp. dk4132]